MAVATLIQDVEQEMAETVIEVGLPETPVDKVTARVRRGIAVLEEKHGPDFDRRLDLDTLSLSSMTNCVLGQLYGDYALRVTKLPGIGPVSHGFEAGNETYGELTRVWKRELLARRAELSLSA